MNTETKPEDFVSISTDIEYPSNLLNRVETQWTQEDKDRSDRFESDLQSLQNMYKLEKTKIKDTHQKNVQKLKMLYEEEQKKILTFRSTQISNLLRPQKQLFWWS